MSESFTATEAPMIAKMAGRIFFEFGACRRFTKTALFLSIPSGRRGVVKISASRALKSRRTGGKLTAPFPPDSLFFGVSKGLITTRIAFVNFGFEKFSQFFLVFLSKIACN
ncbi:MAG: hypothetical protein KDM91_13860 [Verrucomicrobiae bacterium]|nr:hypothetical protein [Verrucomicrobiae bacterium]MCP5542228.1 hypothetical protein [Akkermansiaceae bacterium]